MLRQQGKLTESIFDAPFFALVISVRVIWRYVSQDLVNDYLTLDLIQFYVI